MDWYVGDLLVTIDGYGSITYNAAVDWRLHIVEDGPDFWSADGATGLVVYSASGTTTVSIVPDDDYGSPTPPVWSTSTQSQAITMANSGVLKGAYHGAVGNDAIDLSVYTGSRIFYGYDGDDTVQGSAGDDTVYAGGGDDIVNGGGGNDTIDGGAGTNELNGGDGADIYKLIAHSTNILDDNSGSNQLHLSLAQSEVFANVIGNSVELYNASGTFQTSIADYRSFVSITFSNSVAVSMASFLNVPVSTLPTPTPGDDGIDARYYGSALTIDLLAGHDTFYGSALSDVIFGNDGNDVIEGYNGDDVIEGGNGNDTLSGQGGADTLSYASATAGITVNLTSTTAQNTGGAGTDTVREFENLRGSAFNDILTGNTSANIMEGGAGNDTINGNSGTDTLTYASAASGVTVNLTTLIAQNTVGAGTDTISNFENLTGSAFNDTLTGNTANNVIDGGAGNDTLNGNSGTDTVAYTSASAGVAVSLAVATAQNTLGAGTDTISGFENLTGSAFNDVLTGDATANVIDGGSGNDLIQGGAGNDTLTGGAGVNTVSYSDATAAVTVNLPTTSAQNTVGAGTDTISGFLNLTGSAFNDTLTGTSGNNVIEGGAGNDTINAGNGTDTLTYVSATAGITINLATATAQNTGGAGTDTITAFENLTGSAFNDTLTGTTLDNVMEGGAGNDTINGDSGTDTLTYANATAGVTVNLATATAQNTGGAGTDTISNFENLAGSAFNDNLTGTTANNIMEGGAGDDTMNGGNGDDTLVYMNATAGVTLSLALASAQNTGGAGTDTVSNFEHLTGSIYGDTLTGSSAGNTIDGGIGNDIIDGGAGADWLLGGQGIDTLSFASATAAVTANLATGLNSGGAGTDSFSGFENLTGSGFNDNLNGDTAANTINGGNGNDTVYADSGNDILYGDDGLDALYGGNGADILYGGAGADSLTGGIDSGDTFVFETASAFASQDTITDFSAGQNDKIDIHDIIDVEFDPLTEAISQFVDFTNSGGNSIMSIDRDGAGMTYGFVNIATLSGVINLDETTLYNNGNLLAA